MASKLGILLVVFLSIVSLQLISSASFHRAGGLHRRHHRHHHRHRLFRPIIFPRVEDVSIEHGDEDNERIPRFANPALDGSRKNEDDEYEEDEHEERRDAERRAKRRAKRQRRGDGDDDETSTPTFSNPALDKGKDEEDEHEEDRGTERRAKRRGNGDDEETSTPTFSNPALDKGKNEEDEHEDEEKDEDEAEERGNGDDDETSGTADPGLDEKKIEEPKPEEPQPEEPKGQEGVAGGAIGGLQEAFYDQSCPQAEKIGYDTIQKHLKKDPSLAPAVVRLFFHDCFVTGCDASVLLDATPTGEEVEKKSGSNGPLVRGFDIIDDIKTQIEAQCPGVVSCADILAFANRDSLVFTGVPNYGVAAGRRDGLSSLAKNADANLPTPDMSAEQNIQMFQKKGMSLEDLVVLIGAHSIGSAHCSMVTGRFHDQEKAKEIDPGYLFKMQTLTLCQSQDQVVPFDPYSQHQMDSRYYKELLTNKALIESDHRLAKEVRTRNVMNKLVDDQEGWLAKFTAAIKKLGEVEVLTGDKGEIRKQCTVVNGKAQV